MIGGFDVARVVAQSQARAVAERPGSVRAIVTEEVVSDAEPEPTLTPRVSQPPPKPTPPPKPRVRAGRGPPPKPMVRAGSGQHGPEFWGGPEWPAFCLHPVASAGQSSGAGSGQGDAVVVDSQESQEDMFEAMRRSLFELPDGEPDPSGFVEVPKGLERAGPPPLAQPRTAAEPRGITSPTRVAPPGLPRRPRRRRGLHPPGLPRRSGRGNSGRTSSTTAKMHRRTSRRRGHGSPPACRK